MTRFEKKGRTKDTKFKVIEDDLNNFRPGDIVWLSRDDNTLTPYFTDGIREHALRLSEVEPLQPATKDTIFNVELTGEELVYLAIATGNCRMGEVGEVAYALDDAVYAKLEGELLEFADSGDWINAEISEVEKVIEKVFPAPEQRQYKELQAQYETIVAQMVELRAKLEGEA